MYINVAVLKETQPHERRAALVPAVIAKLVKRGEGKGYAGIVNGLFYGDNCSMVYGDAQAALIQMIEAVRGLGLPAAA